MKARSVHLMSSRFALGASLVAGTTLAPQIASAQATYAVNIESTPAGAAVRVDSESAPPVCPSTPCRAVRVPRGAHTLYYTRDGWVPARLDVNVRRARETFTAQMTQAGSIYVTADVEGAQIRLDGTGVGTTPGRLNNVPPGAHVVEIVAEGMQPFRETVNVGAGAVAAVSANLRPRQAPTGIVRVIVSNPAGPIPSDLQVAFDGVPMTGTPPSIENAQPGQHIIQVTANGFRTIRRQVDVTAGQTQALAVDLERQEVVATGGTIRVIVSAIEGAVVTLDGEVLAGTPPQRDNIPAGSHILRVTAPGRQPFSETITVEVGRQLNREITEQNMPVQAVTNRLSATCGTPDAHVFVDGRDMGTSPYVRADQPAGSYTITIRAPGHDEFTQRCTVSASTACEVTATLTRTVGRGSIRVELNRPVAGAMVTINGGEPAEIGAGRDVPEVPAGTREVRVQAPGYEDFVTTVTVRENAQERVLAQLRRRRAGPGGQSLRERRTAISTWGASPLYAGDVALDFAAAFGEYYGMARGTVGLVQSPDWGVDAGLLIRTLGWMWEFELRGRSGVRFLNGLFSLGGELDLRAGLGIAGQNTFGLSAFAVASLQSLAPTSDEDADAGDERERTNRAGTFAFSLRVGLDAARDNLAGSLYRGSGEQNPRFDACNQFQPAMGALRPSQCGEAMGANAFTLQSMAMGGGTMPTVLTDFEMAPMGTMRAAAMADERVRVGSQGILRAVIGLTIEVGLSRHWNLFAGIDRVLTSTDQPYRRAIYQGSWFGNDSFTYIRLGTTFKF